MLARHPVCMVPGCNAQASHVDHKRSLANGGAPYDPANLECLCPGCHSRKTNRQDGGFGNARRDAKPLRAIGCNADGSPRDPRHHWNR